MKHLHSSIAVAAALTGTVAAQVPTGQSQPPSGWIDYGVEMAAAGDIDGDGANDLFVAAWVPILPAQGVNGVGLRVLSGLDLHVLWERTELPVAPITNYRLPRIDGGPDVNADGVPDLLLAADCFFGQGRVDVLSGVDGSVIHHASPTQLSANDVVAAHFVGDLDGDGTDDYAAGFSTFGQFGKIVWFSGATGNVLQSVPSNGQTLLMFGYPMSAIGDLDGDGVLELSLGDTSFNGSTGRAWIHNGRTGALIRTVDGEAAGDGLGGTATDLGDIDSDGHPDFAISAVGAKAVRAFSGATGAKLWDHAESQPFLNFGAGLSRVEDLDADGVSELLVGGVTHNIQSSPLGLGRAWILSGASGATLSSLAGSPLGDYFGLAVQGVDLDGDGRSEIVIAAPDLFHQASLGGRIEAFSTCPLPPQYTCIGNQSQAGCIPALSVYGSTIWSAPVNLTLSGQDLPRFQPSLLLVGHDPGELTFGSNTLCLDRPFRRILPQITGGSPQGSVCSGLGQRVLDQPLLTSLGYGPGDGLTAQIWIADPPSVRGALSNAIRIVLCP